MQTDQRGVNVVLERLLGLSDQLFAHLSCTLIFLSGLGELDVDNPRVKNVDEVLVLVNVVVDSFDIEVLVRFLR